MQVAGNNDPVALPERGGDVLSLLPEHDRVVEDRLADVLPLLGVLVEATIVLKDSEM